jgi:hypothetical protein
LQTRIGASSLTRTGQADLIREAVGGRVGEDPPASWRPEAGRYRVVG